jgi:hypothetical protein
MNTEKKSAYRQYLRRLVFAAALYLIAIFAAAELLDKQAPISSLALGVALTPGLAVVMILYSIGRLLIELSDEFLRMLEIRKALVATGITLAITSVWGLLEMFTAVPALPVFWVFPIWCGGLVIGAIYNRFAFGAAGLM